MNERNYDRLREALDHLPTYNSPTDNWAEIARQLMPPLSEQLPSYAPPPAVWNTVSQQLDAMPRGRLRSLPLQRLLSIAATILFLIASGVFLMDRGEAGPTVSYSYSQEAQPTPVTADWDDDEASFDRARQEVLARNEPQLNNLGHELDELTSAREEVKSMLTAYGNDPTVVQQLAEIERERADVYRRIIIEL